MTRAAIVLVLLLACRGNEAAKLREQARTAMSTDPAKAVELLTKAIERDPKSATSHALRAAAYLGVEDFKRAKADANTALDLDPTELLALLVRCEVFVREEAYDAANTDCGLVAEKASDQKMQSIALGMHAQSLVAQKKHAEAEVIASKALGLAESDAAYFARGRARLELRRLDEAAADFAMTKGDEFLLRLYSGRVRELQGRWNDALAEYDRAASAPQPKNGRARVHTARSRVLEKLNRPDEAIDAQTKAIELSTDPETQAGLHNNRAWQKLMLGRATEALADADKSLELRPKDPHALGTRCWIHFDLGRLEDAERDCTAGLAIRPESLHDQGMLALVRKDPDGAIAAWSKKLEQDSTAVELIPWIERARRAKK